MTELQRLLQSALGAEYRIERELRGGMSRVFVAEDVRLGRKVVLKMLPPDLTGGVNAERFEREIRVAARLQHPHIVPLLAAGSAVDLPYYVMPYIEGECCVPASTGRGNCRWPRWCGCSRRCSMRCSTRTHTASCTATSSRTTSCSPPIMR